MRDVDIEQMEWEAAGTHRARLLAKAERFGIDVEPERCDFTLLEDELAMLSEMTPEERAVEVARIYG